MEPFRYSSSPNPGNSTYRGVAKYRGTMTTAEIITEVKERIGSAPITAENVTQTLCEVIIDTTIQGWRIEPLYGLIGYFYACGGSQPGPDFAPTFDNLRMALAGYTGETGASRAALAFTAEKVSDQGRIVPVIIRVTDMSTGLNDHYTASANMQVELQNKRFKLDPQLAYHGVFFKSTTGVIVPVTNWALITPSLIVFTVPAGLTGDQELSIAGEINGQIRTGIYPHLLS